MRKYFLPLLGIVVVLLGSSCAATQEYKTIATIKDIMDSEVDPSADFIWESVGTVITEEGRVDRAPKTVDEWKEERRRAITLVEAANLLVMPGRHVANPGEKSENPGIELGPEEIEALINNDRATFVRLARSFQDTAVEELKMVDAQDIEGILRVGGELDATCENCHRKYWYPNELGPPDISSAPTEGKK